MDPEPSRRSLIVTVREYLGIRPVGFRSAARLYGCYARAGVARLFHPAAFHGTAPYLGGRDPLRLRTGRIDFLARPQSEDIDYFLPSHKPQVGAWFHPAPQELVVDVGAHTGYFALSAGRAGASVIAIEPNPPVAEILRENVRANGLQHRIAVHELAVGATSGTAMLYAPEKWDGFASLRPDRLQGSGTRLDEIPVRMGSIDDLLTQAEPERAIDWMLVDVEGSEAAALQGAREALSRTRRLIVEVAFSEREEVRRILGGSAGLRRVQVERHSARTEYWLLERDPSLQR